jgi:hypothetical protein
MRHGSPWTYRNHGCRCESCKTAWSDYNRARRARRIAEGPNPQRHGMPSSYINHGCRCDECTAAIQNYRRQYRTRRKQEANRARRKVSS